MSIYIYICVYLCFRGPEKQICLLKKQNIGINRYTCTAPEPIITLTLITLSSMGCGSSSSVKTDSEVSLKQISGGKQESSLSSRNTSKVGPENTTTNLQHDGTESRGSRTQSSKFEHVVPRSFSNSLLLHT